MSQSAVDSFNSRESLLRRDVIVTTMILLVILMGFLSYLIIQREALPFNNFRAAAVVTVLFCLLCIGLIKSILKVPIFSFPILFAGVTFVFTLSGFLMVPLDGWYAFKNFILIDQASILQGLPIVSLAFASLLFGALFSVLRKPNRNIARDASTEGIRIVRNIGLFLYWLSILLISIWTALGSGVGLAFTGGYEEFVTHRILNLIPYQVIAPYSWFLPWSCLILIGTSQTKRQNNLTLVMVGIAILVYLLTGDRNGPSTLIVLMIAASYLLRRPFKLWQIGMATIFLLVFISSLDALRMLPVKDWTQETVSRTIASETFGISDGAQNYSVTSSYRTPFAWLLSNTSNSYQTLMGALRLIPQVEPFRYGRDYLVALSITVPFLPSSGFINVHEHPTTWITDRLYPGALTGLGFLQVGEAYINFGAAGVIGLYFILGWLLSYLWKRLSSGQLNPQLLSYSLIFMNGLLTWVRNDSSNMGRTLIWGWLIVYALPTALLTARRFK